MRPAVRRIHIDGPDEFRCRGIGNIEGGGLTSCIAVSHIKPLVLFVHDRMMGVLTFVTRLAILESGKPCTSDQLRLSRILQIENLDDDITEARFPRRRIKITGLLRPPALMRAHDELAAAAGAAGIGWCSGDLRNERDL